MGNGPPNRMMMFNPGQPNMIRGPRMANMPNVRMPQQQAVQQQVCTQNKVLISATWSEIATTSILRFPRRESW